MNKTKVLIVDDEVIPSRALSAELERLGYEICPLATSGKEALKLAEHERPDMVLMDLGLRGEMDGIQTARQIKDSFGIPVIYLTGYPDDETKEAAGVSEPYEYLVKPVHHFQICKAIDFTLQKGKRPSDQQSVE
jgi:CheY-like chemotaxis protein